MKSIILYNPKAVFFDMPLAIISLGSLVCERYRVIIIDARIENESEIQFLLDSNLDNCLLVGITSLTGAPLLDAIQFTNQVRRKNEKIPIIWGGWHTSLFPEKTLRDIPAIDIAVQGQGESTFLEIVEHIEKKLDYSLIRGIAFRDKLRIVKNPPRILTDLNTFGKLNYDLIDVEKYFVAKGNRQFDFISSIGCFFRCTFCADPFVYNRKFSSLTTKRIADDLLFYCKKYNFTDVNFQDETFFTYPDKIVEMAQIFHDNGTPFSWAATMRADQGSRMSKNQFEICKKGGLRRLLIGVESGSQEMMDWLKKDIKIVQVEKCAALCKELEISALFPFIVGFPGETDDSILASKIFIRKLALMSSKFETPIFYFKPYPGTKITDDVVANGSYKLPESVQEWAEFDYIGSKGPWVSEEKFDFFEKYKFYLRLVRQKESIWSGVFVKFAKWRIANFYFKWPIEKFAYELVKNKKKLS